jgi:GTP pyrophosphokinase
MAAVKKKFSYLANGRINLDKWLQYIKARHAITQTNLLEKSARLTQTASQGLTTFYGQSCLQQGLEMAEIILELRLDQAAAAAASINSSANDTHLTVEVIKEQLGEDVAQLITGVKQPSIID